MPKPFARQTFTALMYSIGMFEELDMSLNVSVLTISKPDWTSRSQSSFSRITFFPNPFGGFVR